MLRRDCAYAQPDQSLSKSLENSMTVKLLTEHHLEFLSLKGGCTGSSEFTLVKWQSHVVAQLYLSPRMASTAFRSKAVICCCLFIVVAAIGLGVLCWVLQCWCWLLVSFLVEPVHEISNNGMCDQQSLRSACAYAQSDQSLCKSLEYSMIVKLLTEHHLEFLS